MFSDVNSKEHNFYLTSTFDNKKRNKSEKELKLAKISQFYWKMIACFNKISQV